MQMRDEILEPRDSVVSDGSRHCNIFEVERSLVTFICHCEAVTSTFTSWRPVDEWILLMYASCVLSHAEYQTRDVVAEF